MSHNVLSLFDGISCGRIALERAGIQVDKYFASEIDKNAIKVAQHNYPNTIQLGDVTKINPASLPKIDILLGGSPCQTVSLANQGGKDINEGKSKLFFDYVRILNHLKAANPNLVFLLENVPMSVKNRDIISAILGVEPVTINSSLVSIQNRKRLYWTNIKEVRQPEDKRLYLRDHYCKQYDSSLILTGKGLNKLNRPRNRAISILSDKSPTLMKSQEGIPTDAIVFQQDGIYRYPTRRECELMQTLPIGYTEVIPYRLATGAIGNGWTIDVVAHILENIV